MYLKTIWLRLFLLMNLFVSFYAWACGASGCTMAGMGEMSSSSSSLPQASSASSNTSYTFSDSGNGAAVATNASPSGAPTALKGAIKFDKNKPHADFGELARGDAQWRAVMKNDKGGAPAARLEHQSVMRGASAGVALDQDVVWPAAYRGAREAAGKSRVRTITTDGE